jgi:hypothetical protein
MRSVFVILILIGAFGCKNSGSGTSANIDLSADTLFIEPPAYIVSLNAIANSKSDSVPERLMGIVKRTFLEARNTLNEEGAQAIMGNFSFVATRSSAGEGLNVFDMTNSGGFALAWPKDGKPILYDFPTDALVIKKDVLGLSAQELQDEKVKKLNQK